MGYDDGFGMYLLYCNCTDCKASTSETEKTTETASRFVSWYPNNAEHTVRIPIGDTVLL